MSQDLFNHSLLARQDVFRAFAKLVEGVVREEFIQRVNEYIIVVVDNAQEDILTRAREAPWTLIPLPGNASTLPDRTTSELIDSVHVVKMPVEQNHDLDPDMASAVMSELLARVSEREIIIQRLEEKLSRFEGMHPNNPGVQALPRAVGCGVINGLDLVGLRRRLNSAAKRFLRSCFRSPQDGLRVSREKHEYD